MNQADLEQIREYTNAMRNFIRLNDPGAILWAINNMPRYLVPHVKHVLEDNKKMIMRYIAAKASRYGFLDNLVIGSINALDTARIDWKDIAIIKQGIHNAELQLLADLQEP
jgi:hypothetical protein